MKRMLYILFLLIIVLALFEVMVRQMGYQSNSLLTTEEVSNVQQIGLLTIELDEKVELLPYIKANEHGFMVLNAEKPFHPEKESDLKEQFPEISYLLSNYYDAEDINEFGFRDWKKEDINSKKRKIALIGDSFVWGIGAQPVDSSFSNLLSLDTSLQVFNLSVAGVDLSVYAKVAQEYVPMIEPDLTIVCIYATNDLVNYDKKLEPFQYNDIYPTNVGAFFKINQNYVSEDSIEVFNNYESAYKAMRSVVHFESLPFSWLASYNFAYRAMNGLKSNVDYEYTRFPKANYSREFASKIQEACDRSGSEVFFVMIPSLQSGIHEKLEKELGKSVTEPTGFTIEDFNSNSDEHLNNQGCRKYAQFLKNLIEGSN